MRIQMTAIAFVIGMVISGIVCFFVAACIVAEERGGAQKAYDEGYTQGYKDGLEGKHVSIS